MAVTPLESHFRTYSQYLKRHFGFPVFRISVDAGFTCPNRDGTLDTSGCIYCNNDSFTPLVRNLSLPIEAQITQQLEKRRGRIRRKKFIVYFQAYSNTYAPVERLRTLYEQAISFENCVGISIGTRSDCVDDEKLTLLEELAARTSVTLEYGLQSPHLKSLLWMRRGHDYDSFVRAVEETARRRILTGAHIILGIPGETREMMRETAVLISGLPIRFLKIHQLQVIRGTPLSNLYEKNPFPLWDLDEYADFICEFIEELRQDMVIQRLYSTSRPDLLIGPVWGGIRRDVDRILHERIRSRHVIQGRRRKEAIR